MDTHRNSFTNSGTRFSARILSLRDELEVFAHSIL